MKYLALALMLVAAASAHEAEEGRTLFTSSSGNMYLGLNDSTLLIGVIGLALAGGLLFVALQTFGADAFLPAQSSAYDRYSTHPDLAYANSAAANAALAYAQNQHEQHQQYRRKRSPFTYSECQPLFIIYNAVPFFIKGHYLPNSWRNDWYSSSK